MTRSLPASGRLYRRSDAKAPRSVGAGASSRLARPSTAFCSWSTVGTRPRCASSDRGGRRDSRRSRPRRRARAARSAGGPGTRRVSSTTPRILPMMPLPKLDGADAVGPPPPAGRRRRLCRAGRSPARRAAAREQLRGQRLRREHVPAGAAGARIDEVTDWASPVISPSPPPKRLRVSASTMPMPKPKGQQRRAAIADEGQGHALGRHQVQAGRHVDPGLQAELGSAGR